MKALDQKLQKFRKSYIKAHTELFEKLKRAFKKFKIIKAF
jgi:hypothetical protein